MRVICAFRKDSAIVEEVESAEMLVAVEDAEVDKARRWDEFTESLVVVVF